MKEGQNIVSGSVTYAGSTASFNPTSDLQESKIYTATITTGAMSLSGVPIADNYVWSFKKIADR
ncbi:MAG: Ig-like domain-containing protein [Saprospiraceae bacterium]|nr:Ig-like domain-containing protein [Saprospiraceae bacterium]